ncbi:hypothetical protein [Dactylosporangium sp. NPDC000521]|uniref:hypothetical protein n=1 Tax=Dactylosporangium sp. NPDC000521 TaxID=3363975 RepID=UPI0036BFF7C8
MNGQPVPHGSALVKILACRRNGTVVDCRNSGMTDTTASTDMSLAGERELTYTEIEAFRRDSVLLDERTATPERYPRMFNVLAGFHYRAIVRPDSPEPPEYVTLPMQDTARDEFEVAVARWNQLWEAAQFRRRFFADTDELPPKLQRIADQGDLNVVFVPRTRTRYYEHAPLFHLLPREVPAEVWASSVATRTVAVDVAVAVRRQLPATGLRSATGAGVGSDRMATPGVGFADDGVYERRSDPPSRTQPGLLASRGVRGDAGDTPWLPGRQQRRRVGTGAVERRWCA